MALAEKKIGQALSEPEGIHSIAISEQGSKRPSNDDFHINDDENLIYIVADGMGAYDRSIVASTTLATELHDSIATTDNIHDAIPSGLYFGLTHLLEFAKARYDEMKSFHKGKSSPNPACVDIGTTISILYLQQSSTGHLIEHIFNIGDSRVYGINDRNGVLELERLTRDDSFVQDMIDAATITPEEGEVHEMRHVITNSLGIKSMDMEIGEPSWEKIQDRIVIKAVPHNRRGYLLCCDGLTDTTTDNDIAARIRENYPDKWKILDGLVDSALHTPIDSEKVRLMVQHGGHDASTVQKFLAGMDNITMIYVALPPFDMASYLKEFGVDDESIEVEI